MLQTNYENMAELRSLKRNLLVPSLLKINGTPTPDGPKSIYRPGEDPDGGLQQTMHNDTLAGEEGHDYVSIWVGSILKVK